MIEVKRSEDGVIHLKVSGKIDSEEMRKGMDEFFKLVGDAGPVDMFYEIKDITVPTPGAIAVELSYLPQLFGLLKRIRKVALVANQGWVRKAARVESAIIPGLTIEVFEPGEEDKAWEYVTGKKKAA